MKMLPIRGGGEFPVEKILCLGRNYRAHAEEMGSKIPLEPVIFLKPSTAIVNN
ncbi:MAG TPA: FAA hydrolase family protein, partial [Euryarchaeota archaeon]|nr:FAA hydrolase family protein [Euryarchaeota archaeon]